MFGISGLNPVTLNVCMYVYRDVYRERLAKGVGSKRIC